MADIKTNQSKVYNALKGMGFSGIGASEQEFAAKMSNPKNRAKVYKALSERGYKGIGADQAAFDTLIYRAPATAEPQPTQTHEGKTAGTVAQPAQPQPTQQSATQHQQTQQPKQGYKPTDMEMMGFGMTINSAQGAVDSAKESLERTIQNQETFRKQKPLGGGVAKSAPKFNAETGQMEQSYITSAGTEHTDKNQAEDIQRRLRDAAWREAHPLEAAERENTQDMRDIRMEEERLTERRKAAEGEQPQGWWETFKRNLGASLVTGMAPMGSNVDRDMVEAEMTRHGAYGAERQGIQKEQDMLLARRRLAEETQQLLADVRRDREIKGIGSGLLRAGGKVLETALNPRTWDFGEADMASQFAVADAVMKADSGLGLSSNEQKLLDTWAKNAAINSQFADQLSGWTKAGIVTGESLPFMLEMAMNPASGLGEAATAQLMKYSLKKYGTKWVKDHAKSMLAKKIATRLIGDVVGAGVMANTTGLARVAADAQSRMTGQVDIQLDPNGDVIYKGVKDAESPGAAIFKAMASTSIENWSEMAGNYLGFINSFFGKALGKSVVGKAGRKMLAETGSIEGVSLNKAQKFIYELAAGKGIGAFNQGLAQFAKRTQWHGVIGEYLEEEIGNIANAAIVGDMTFDTKEGTGVFNLQQNIDTFCGVALMGGFMSALNTVGYVGHRINYDVDRVSNANAQLFGDELWRRIRTTIDSSISDPRGLNETLTDLIRGDGSMFDENGKKAILKYTQAALEKQGAEMAQYQPRMASSTRQKNNETGGWEVSSMDKNGDVIETQTFETEDEAKAYEGELKMNQQWQDYRDNLSMTNKLSYPEAAQAVDEFIRGLGDGFDYAETVAAINDPKSEIGKRFLQFKTEKILLKAEANRQAIEAFEEENGWTPGTVQWLSEQDPMQLDAEGLAMADQARDFLEGLAYPAGEVHVEHEQQLGADTAQAVVENVISTEEPIDQNNNAGQQLADAYKTSINNMTALFDRNEEIKEEFYRLQGMGLSPQEIISSLDSFRPEDVQTIIDWYNANARYQSFMDEASRQIDRVAHSNRERRTFHGTINGNADNQNVIVISDGTNSYTLVSGNVTMDGGGRITGTDSGLIIGLDENGDFVQLGDGSGYSVVPGAMSLDQLEEMERERLQQQVSLVVDPAGAQAEQEAAAQPQPTEQQAGNVGGEAGANTGTGADETPTPAPATPTPPVNPPSPSEEDAGIPAVSIESVTDEDGVKHYEQGIPVDDAINDMENDPDVEDVVAEADLAISEAQAELDKIGEPKTRADRVKNGQRKRELQGTIDYYNQVKERYAQLHPPYVDPQPYIERLTAATSRKKADEILQEALQAGVKPEEIQPVHTQKISDLIAKEEEERRKAEEITDKDRDDVAKFADTPEGRAWLLDRKRVPNLAKRMKLAKLIYGSMYDDDFDAWRGIRELIASWLSKGRTLDPDSFGQELGWDMSVGKDAAKVSTMFARRRENGGDGMLFNDFVHMVMEASGGRYDTEQIRNELIAMFQGAQEKYDLTEYQFVTRVAEAEQSLQDLEREADDADAGNEPAGQIEEGGLPFPPANDNEPPFGENTPPTPPTPPVPDVKANPLTVEEIDAADAPKHQKTLAKAYLNGNHGELQTQAYADIYEDVRGVPFEGDGAAEIQQPTEPAKQEDGETRMPETPKAPKGKKTETPQYYQPKWQYEFHYDKQTGRAWITREDVSGPIPIGDGRFRVEGRSLAELRAILENPANNLGDLLKEIGAELHNAEAGERIRNAETPTAAIEEAASSFREEQERQSKRERMNETQEQRDKRKRQNETDIADALAAAKAKQKELLDQLKAAREERFKLDRPLYDPNAPFAVTDPLTAAVITAGRIVRKSSIPQSKEERKIFWQLVQNSADLGYMYIKQGVRDFKDWSQRMLTELVNDVKDVFGWEQEQVDDYLDKIWNAEVEADGETKTLAEWAGQKPNDVNEGDNTVNEHKGENNEPENVVSSQQKPASKLEGDSAEFAERQQKIAQLSKKIRAKLQGIANWGDQPKPLSAYKQIVKELGIENLSDTDLQELIETEVVNLAREIANKEGLTDEKKFQKIVKLYEGQPSLNARDNDRINKQQYSTPAPMAYLMGKFLKEGKEVKSGLEPSAGNGMLTLNLPKEAMHVNDIDEMRLSNLAKQGFGEVTSQDGTQPFGEKKYDVVVTNPPFGSVAAKTYDGYTVTSLEQQMVLNALDSMKDDGRAAIIIGGNTEYKPNGSISGKDKAFLNYLYSHYNVVDVINCDGKALYSRQGTGYDVRMILINGRKQADNSFAPVKSKARAERVNSYDELYKRVNDDILSDSNKSAGVHDTASGESNGKHDNGHADAATQTGVRNVQPGRSSGKRQLLDSDGQPVSGGVGSTQGGTETRTDTSVGGRNDVVHGTGSTATQSSGSAPSPAEQGGNVPNRRNDSERPDGRVDVSVGGGSRPSVEVRRLGTEKVPYRQQSKNPYSLQSQMPAEQAEVVKKALEELGDVDEFLVKELGYSSVEDLHHGSQSPEKHGGLAAEQIDSVAMAIHQMNEGNAFIIGDQTGIGKGRQAAALIRYGVKKGGCPVFITVKKGLFSDMYRDLCDIGSPGLRPFIWSADDEEHSADVTDKNGNVVYKRPSDKEQKRVVDYINKYGKLPPEYDYIVTTYDSFKGGTMVYEEGQKKARNFGKKSPTTGAYNSQAKRDALERLAENSYVIMDESHNAGGETSAVSGYLQYITTRAKGVTFLSATFAKRPGNMPIYSLKTAIAKAGVKIGELIDAVKQGGATFQEIMSKALTEAGQMIRRERDMTGVTIDWKGIEDEAVIEKQRQQYDTIIGLFNDIIDFQRRYVDPIVNKKNDEAADEQGEVDHTPGTRDMGINNTPFASRTYNMVQQVLLSLKAEETAKRAIEHLKQGHKPVIALANTNEGAADEVSTGEDMKMPDLSVNLKKGLQGTLRITKKDAFGNSTNEMIPFDELSEEGRARYQEIMDAIENASSGLSLSPIDVIKNELKKAGYKVGELTGRKQEFVYNDDGTVKRVKRQDGDKKKVAADFNNGKLDALILNKSAGTGISLHASSTYDDQRQRVMIVAQAQGDVNDEVQIRGRIDRTGQVLRGMYEYVVSQIPSEQRLLMMLKAKLRSLDANTTSSQKSKFNEMQVQDIINKYGDDIVIQYLAEHTDLAAKMVDPLKWGEGFETMPAETLIANATKDGEAGKTASKVLGRMALLKVAEQEKMLAEIGDLYQAEIDRLNEMGENDLEITEMPLKAKTISKKVWEEGVEPGGKNPFADNSYVEEVEMDILKKPMKAEEVKKSQARLLGGKSWDEYKQGVLNKLDAWEAEKKREATDTITARAEKKAQAEKEKYIKGAKKAQEKNQMTDAEIEKNGQYQYDHFYKEEMNKLQASLDAVDKQKQAFVDALETFTTDGVYALPTDIYELGELSFDPSFGKVIDIKISDNFSTAASTISFATLDGRRKITIPISGMVKQVNGEKKDIKPIIVQQTAQSRSGFFGSNIANMIKVLEQNVDNWDKLTSTATRKKGYIITGNLLKALTSLQKQHQGGKLISYTTDTGEIRQGVLMGERFDPGALTSQNPISSAKADLDDWEKDRKITSADGDVTIKAGGYGSWVSYTLKVPKSKKKGEKYFNDKVLLSLMDGQFEGSSALKADFKEENLDAVLKRLDELGVTVENKEKKTDNADTGRRYDEGAAEIQPHTERKNRIAKHVESLLKKLGTKSRTTVYHSFDELPSDMKQHIRERERQGKKVRGWYENGRIYLYLPHIDSVYQAEKTIWHETVAHHGLRELVGAENYNKLLKRLWLEHRGGDMHRWVTERMQQNGWKLNEAIDEYLARQAEKEPFKEPSLWQRLRWLVADLLRKIGFKSDPTLTDIKYLFWVSRNRLTEGDAMSAIKQQAFLFRLEQATKRAGKPEYVNMNAANEEDIYDSDAEGAYDDGTRYSEETDEEVIERLEKEPKIKVYRAMSLIDGKLYPPMATKQDGQLREPIELGKWEKSDEHPEKAVKRNGKWVFKLTKDNGKSLFAAYNPYIHTSTTMLNDQFSEAQNRPNLVVVEVEVPVSELTSGYKAEKAKDAVGRLEWKAGIIQGQLTGTREVILSRWDKPVRIVPTEEVAKSIAKQINGKVEVMPTNVVTPAQRQALEKEGVKFVETDNRGKIVDGPNKGKTYSSVYGKKSERRYDEDIDDPLERSEKAVYDERLNRVETVFTEAYQDSMIALKTAQNAIAHDKAIPDSQNAYMAENLMHGKNKNEQDLFNKLLRDPLIATINKIMDATGMNWGDIDRYVYTKSGLERNREFFVRDWLERERNKNIRKYEDLNPEEQEVYDRKAEAIETLFEDGDIETEEQKEKELAKALQEAHQEYVDSIEERWIALKQRNYLDMQTGDINFADYLAGLTNFILDNIDGDYNPSESDYSGFRAMYGDEDGKYDEDEIIDELMDTEEAINETAVLQPYTELLWEQINAATQYGLERYREAGMRSDEQIDRVEQMFHWYVPMRGFKEDKGEDMYQYFTGKDKAKSYVGGLLKHAKGRGSEANYPISTIFAMTYKAISDCNQNLVNQKLYRLCQANPNDLVVLSDSWAKLNEQTGEWEEVAPEIDDDMDEKEIKEATLAFEEEMRQLATENKAKKIKGKEHFDYKPMDKKKKSEHIVDVRINGQQKRMIVVGNPRMAQALNGQLRFENGAFWKFSKWNATIKNFMASVFTSYSPTFALRNMFRDWTHFRTMLGVREGHDYASRANKYYRQSLFKMVGLFRKYREGRLDESIEMERDFKDFMDNGGVTGFVFMQKLDDIQKDMENIYKKQKAGKPIRLNNTLWEKILGAVEAMNEGVENNARFATYRASRHYAGRTKARSAYDAKEITVNFNRKGAGGKTAGFKSSGKTAAYTKTVEDAAKVFGVTSQVLGEGRIFFNATVQAIATTFKNFQNTDGSLNKGYIAKWAGKYALPPFMFGLALPLINKALAAAFGGDGDDDPYANLPEWTRRRNLCFYIGNGNFITIPIGQELAAFLTLGDIAAGNTYAPDLKPVDKSWDDEIVGVMNTFSPVDISTKITKGGLMEDPISEVTGRTFSVLAPLVAVEQNLAWTGRPIYREDRFGNDQYTPEYQMVYSGTNPVLVNATKLLHEIGGGDDIVRGKFEVNPAIIQYLWEQYTGGPGKVFSNTISIGKDAKDILSGNESEFNIRKVEGLKAFVQQGDDRTEYYRANAKYRKYKAEAEKLYDAVKGYEGGAAENPEYVLKLEQISKGEDFVRMQIVLEADKQLSKINKAANKAEGAERKELRRLYNQQVKAVVDMLDSVGE